MGYQTSLPIICSFFGIAMGEVLKSLGDDDFIGVTEN